MRYFLCTSLILLACSKHDATVEHKGGSDHKATFSVTFEVCDTFENQTDKEQCTKDLLAYLKETQKDCDPETGDNEGEGE